MSDATGKEKTYSLCAFCGERIHIDDFAGMVKVDGVARCVCKNIECLLAMAKYIAPPDAPDVAEDSWRAIAEREGARVKEIEALRNELRRLQSVVCEEDYDIIAALLKEPGE